MSDTELMKVRLEDGEIDESKEPSVLPSLLKSGIVKDLRVVVENFQKAHNPTDDGTTAVFDSVKCNEPIQKHSPEDNNTENAYLKDQELLYIEEDEMLCVRGASPVPFIVERLSYSRKSPLQDCDTISFDSTPPKRRRTTGKRNKKRTTLRKINKDKGVSSDEHTELRKSNSQERMQSPQGTQDKLPQLCKFYFNDRCAKRSKCEYMHSEFPCKFYYMGLKCEAETTETRCKLAHGGALSAEMLSILARHINTAPIDVLGQEFVDMRSKMEVDEINNMLKNTQNNLTPPKKAQEKISSPQNDSSTFFATLKEKLYFLNEDQLNGLKELQITKVDDLLNLTLAQLNAIGIHATQIEAIQMSFVSGQDTDMRNILLSQLEVPIEQKVPSFEIVCYNADNNSDQNWFQQEEGPLVIDETNNADDFENNRETIPEEDDILIDVVGDSNSDSYSSIIEEGLEKVECEVAIASKPESTDPPEHFVIEETQEEIKVLPNSKALSNTSPAAEYSIAIVKLNQEELEILKKTLQEEISAQSQEETQIDETMKELATFKKPGELQDEIQCSKNQDEVQLDENKKEPGVLQAKDELQDEIQCLKEQVSDKELHIEIQCQKNNVEAQLDGNTNEGPEVFSIPEDMIEKQIDLEFLRNEENHNSPKKLITVPNISHDEEKSITVPIELLKEEKRTPSPLSIKSPKENKSPYSGNVVEEIDLTVITPPRRSNVLPEPVQLKSQQNRGYNNPFQRKIMSPVIENKKHYSPVRKQINKKVWQPNFKAKHQMQGDSSSEDWDADERSDIQSPPKEIASPDQSGDESTHFVADEICPEFPQRTRNLDNYQPALEINAHLTYPPMKYQLYEIYMPEYEVNKPTLIEKLLKSNSTDPRLKKFIEKEKNHGVFPQAEYSFFPPNMSKCDPRLRPGCGTNCQDHNYNVSRLLYSYLQRSSWYQELKSNLKIQINHSVSDLVRALNFFHKDPSPQKIFDLFQIECAGVLLEVMRNVGIFIDVNGNITEEPNYKQLCTPLQQQQPPPNFGSGYLGPNTKPGLLGFAPAGMPHPSNIQNNSQMSSENSFARQAFGRDCVCPNNNNDFQPNGSTFYVGGRYPMNRNQEPSFDSGFEPAPYQRQTQKRNFKRR